MCLAVPMKVLEIRGSENDALNPPIAIVKSKGAEATVRLDIIDRMPEPGDYVIVHAGFAIHVLTEQEAQKTLELFEDMAKYD